MSAFQFTDFTRGYARRIGADETPAAPDPQRKIDKRRLFDRVPMRLINLVPRTLSKDGRLQKAGIPALPVGKKKEIPREWQTG
jgi:hypothetical protein